MAEGYFDFVAGVGLAAANLEEYCELQGIMRFASASARDTALSAVKTEGMFAFLKDVNTLTVWTGSAWSTIGPVHGALTAWTPTVTQSGSVAATVNLGQYMRIGRLIKAFFSLSITGTGTASNAVVIGGLPAAAVAAFVPLVCGQGELRDSSASLVFEFLIDFASTTTICIKDTVTNFTDPRLGVSNFTAALISPDLITGAFEYIAAADA